MSSCVPQVSFSLSALVLSTALLNSAARADTWTLHVIGNGNFSTPLAIDASGTVVSQTLCNPLTSCYQTISRDGTLISTTFSPPPIIADDGLSCSAVPGGFGNAASRCNGSFSVWGGDFYDPTLAASICGTSTAGAAARFCQNGGDLEGVWASSGSFDPFANLLPGLLSLDSIVLNANGDFAFTSGRDETEYQAIRVTTPEPGSLLLLGTGAVTAALPRLRRRRRP